MKYQVLYLYIWFAHIYKENELLTQLITIIFKIITLQIRSVPETMLKCEKKDYKCEYIVNSKQRILLKGDKFACLHMLTIQIENVTFWFG